MNLIDARPTVAEGVHTQIRRDIIFGRLKPSEKLKLEGLRTRYGVSVSTLRETLTRLAAEGFVLAEGQRGFEVAPVSAANLREIATLRSLLERHALALSFAAGGIDWEAGVVAAHHKLHQMELRMMAGDHSVKEEWKRYDWEFHRALIAACGSGELVAVHSSVFDKYLRYQMLVLTYRGETAAREHRDLLQAALARDAARAQDILAEHIDGGVRHCLAAGILPGA
ncbi:MAG: FCD domain-containing protein [Rhodobacteraceae bacterium]|nr:FCD domain-containing protein [Paracoccaceae bacterium]